MWRMYKTTMEWYDKKISYWKNYTFKSDNWKKFDNKPGDWIVGVCKYFVRKMTDYFFVIIGKQKESKQNQTLFTAIKQNAKLTRYFGSMYIDFDDYPTYTDAIYDIFEAKINSHIKCRHEYPY